jgi:hypothetical protein
MPNTDKISFIRLQNNRSVMYNTKSKGIDEAVAISFFSPIAWRELGIIKYVPIHKLTTKTIEQLLGGYV